MELTAEQVEALYRLGQEGGGDAALIVNHERSMIEVRTLTAANLSGYRVICDFGHLLEIDHSGADPDAWDAELFQLAAEYLTEYEAGKIDPAGEA